MKNGWITIHRKIQKWEWYQNSSMVHLFLHLLLSANHEDNKWQGILIKRGQVVTGLYKLSAETGITANKIRGNISRLKKTGEIDVKTTNRFSIITLIKHEDYQSEDGRLTNKSQTNHKQITTNKNIKNDKNILYKDGNRFTFKDGTVGIMRWGEWVDIKNHVKLGYEYLKELK